MKAQTDYTGREKFAFHEKGHAISELIFQVKFLSKFNFLSSPFFVKPIIMTSALYVVFLCQRSKDILRGLIAAINTEIK